VELVKPMLAASATDSEIRQLLVNFGYMNASPKLDGIRCTIQNGVAYSRSLKPIRNKYIQTLLGHEKYDGLDGELIVGEPNASDVYTATTGAVMRVGGLPDVRFWIFDNIFCNHSYASRRLALRQRMEWMHPGLCILESIRITNMAELHTYENACLEAGFEGVILRDPSALYKNGRSTAKQGQLIKVKRFTDAEATIIGMEEKLHNGNEAATNELGRTQRSSHKENKIPMGTMGALICRDIETGIQFNIGTGFTEKIRYEFWDNSKKYINRLVKYKSFKIGVKDAPRHPVFLGMRDEDDLEH